MQPPATGTAERQRVLFCHGLESGPNGRKAGALRGAGYDLIAPDCRGLDLAARVALVGELLAAERLLVVGSSYGGITAVLASMRARVPPRALLLCAPALGRDEPPNLPLEQLIAVAPTTIIHGLRDDVVPLDWSRVFAAQTGAKLVEVDDDHRLGESLEIMLSELAAL